MSSEFGTNEQLMYHVIYSIEIKARNGLREIIIKQREERIDHRVGASI